MFLSLTLLAGSCSVWASSELDLLKGEWKEKCRIEKSAPGNPTGPFNSLQISYSRIDKTHFNSISSAFKDQQCRDLIHASRFKFECKPVKGTSDLDCRQTSLENRTSSGPWESEKLVDHSGYTNRITMRVRIEKVGKDHLKLTTIGSEADGSATIELSR